MRETVRSEQQVADITLQVVVVGDGAIGKSTLLSRLMHDPKASLWEIPGSYEPTTFNATTEFWQYRQHHIQVELYDTAGQEAFEALRQLAYPGTDVFIFAYDAGNKASFDNLRHKWIPEVTRAVGDQFQAIICGTKCDTARVVRPEDVASFAAELGSRFKVCPVHCVSVYRDLPPEFRRPPSALA